MKIIQTKTTIKNGEIRVTIPEAIQDQEVNLIIVTEDNYESPFYETATTEEWITAFREWTESHQYEEDTPILSDEAISRESIYGERG